MFSDQSNFGINILKLDKKDNPERLYDQEDRACFVSPDGFTANDISQGSIGDCWFISALASLVGPKIDEKPKIKDTTIQRLLQPEFNASEVAKVKGIYKFNFFKMGQFVDVIIDDFLPSEDINKKAKRAADSETNEWWIPLCEKAYAKFNGSYENIQGGLPTWALTELTGGIAIQSMVSR